MPRVEMFRIVRKISVLSVERFGSEAARSGEDENETTYLKELNGRKSGRARNARAAQLTRVDVRELERQARLMPHSLILFSRVL